MCGYFLESSKNFLVALSIMEEAILLKIFWWPCQLYVGNVYIL